MLNPSYGDAVGFFFWRGGGGKYCQLAKTGTVFFCGRDDVVGFPVVLAL